VKDSTDFLRYEQKAIEQFRLNGYTGISLQDSLIKSGRTHYYYAYQKKFKTITLETTTGKKQRTKSNRTKDFTSVLRALEKEVSTLENNGYPFASIRITEQIEKGESLILKYKIDSGDYFLIDKIHLKSQDKFHEKTLMNLIGIQLGEKYNEDKISNIATLISASKLYRLSRPAEVLFRKGKAEIYIYFQKENASTADGYIGFQQDQITRKLVLNGFIKFQLYNALNRAESFDLDWKSNPDKTQNGHINLAFPFLFNTPLGIGAEIDIRKQDSTFLRTDLSFSLSYYHPLVRFTIFDQLESSDTLRVAPPNFRSYRKNTIGATARISAPTFEAAPWFHPQLYLLGGFYNYRDDTIDDNKQKINNSKYQIRYSQYIDFLKFFRLNNVIQFQGLTSNISLSRNELIYFGGLRSVRGFYELELSGNDIWSFMNEIEFRPVDLFSIFLLYDYSSFQSNGYRFTNSFGLGFALKSKTNTLEIVVANGVLDNNPFDLSNTKIHIGFRSTF
jgi:outer membrane protein assembly factor BamA